MLFEKEKKNWTTTTLTHKRLLFDVRSCFMKLMQPAIMSGVQLLLLTYMLTKSSSSSSTRNSSFHPISLCSSRASSWLTWPLVSSDTQSSSSDDKWNCASERQKHRGSCFIMNTVPELLVLRKASQLLAWKDWHEIDPWVERQNSYTSLFVGDPWGNHKIRGNRDEWYLSNKRKTSQHDSQDLPASFLLLKWWYSSLWDGNIISWE